MNSTIGTQTTGEGLQLASETVINLVSFVNIDSTNDDEITRISQEIGLSDKGIESLKKALAFQTFLSPVNITDVTSGVAYYKPHMKGKISVTTNRSQEIPKTFTFMDDVDQKVLVVTGTVQTRLEKPDDFGCTYGPRNGFFVVFPETINEDEGLEQHSIFRLIIEDTFNWDPENPKNIKLNAFMQGYRIEGFSSQFTEQFPQMVYKAARLLGIPKEQLDVRKVDYAAREEKSQATQNRNANTSTGNRFAAAPGRQQNQSNGFRVTEDVQLP